MDLHDHPDLLAVDGGGSGCRAALIWQGVRLEAAGGPANMYSDPVAATAELNRVLDHLADKAGIGRRDLADLPAYLGIAGVMTDTAAQALADRLALPRARIEDDRRATVTGALGGADGIVASVGTGSFFARVEAGQMRAIGGWGHRFSDEASGAWLGTRLLRATFRAADGRGGQSALAETLLADHGGALGLLDRFGTAAAADLAALAPRLFDASPDDPLAATLLADAETALREALADLGWDGASPVYLTGGIGRRLAARFEPACAPLGSALDGAVRLAAGT